MFVQSPTVAYINTPGNTKGFGDRRGLIYARPYRPRRAFALPSTEAELG